MILMKIKNQILLSGTLCFMLVLSNISFGMSVQQVQSKSYNPNLESSTNTPDSTTASSVASSSSSSNSSSGSNNTVVIPEGASTKGTLDVYYVPKDITVSNGSTITWQNNDITAHTSTARDGSFDTGLFGGGKSASVTVNGQGTVDYYCTVHPWMTGTVTIQA